MRLSRHPTTSRAGLVYNGTMPPIVLAVLGPPTLSRDGAPVALDRQKALALLAYLAITGAAHGREALAALLWPDLEPARATAALRQSLWALGSALGPEVVASDRRQVRLRPGALELDVAAFRGHIAAARGGPGELGALAAAARLYRGELLTGLELRDAAPFEEWRFFEAEALRADLAWALDALADGLHARGDLAGALEAARRRVALDPLHEPAQRRLMGLYAADGQRAAALRQYDEAARALHAELGAEPEPETRALYERILRGDKGTRGQGDKGTGGQADTAAAATDGVVSPLPRPPLPLPPPPAPLSPTGRLPAPATAFVGREAELAKIAELLAEPGCRLLSLLGPGGIGKTRLAIQAAADLAPRFADGAAFVPLAGVADPDLILGAVADALGLSSLVVGGLRHKLEDYLRHRELLLVVDNLEHLAGGAGELGALLEAAPGLRILATSRERLAVPGEWTIDVGGLPLPEGDDDMEAAALRLFVEAARRARPGFALDGEELRAAARICWLAAGAPLAIELAAAWVRLMPVGEIAKALGHDLDFLAGAARGMPERHRGLRAVFDHSWRLLEEAERSLFARLAVFRGGFTLAAAAAVAEQPPAATAARLLALADKSLIRRVAADRYDLHELLRQYAAERLAANPEEQRRAQLAHAGHYLALLHGLEADLKGGEQAAALGALEAERDNVRAAWRSAVARSDRPALHAGLESLFQYYEIRGLFEEGDEMFGRAAAAVAGGVAGPTSVDEAVLLGALLARQGWFALRLYRFESAKALLGWSLDLLRDHLDRPDALAASVIANTQFATGGRVSSPELLREQLVRLQASGDQWSLSLALHTQGVMEIGVERSEPYLLESMAVSRAAGNRRQAALALDSLADLTRDAGELRRACDFYAQALAEYRALNYRWAVAFCLDKSGYLLRQLGDYAGAEERHRESLAISREIGDRLGIAGSLDNLGLVALDRGDLDAAEGLLREGLAIRRQVGHTGSTSISIENQGLLALERGDPPLALALFEESTELRRAAQESWLLARSLTFTGRAYLDAGNLPMARLYITGALRAARSAAAPVEWPPVLADVAALLAAEGALPAAAELAGALLERHSDLPAIRRAAEAVLARTGPPAAPPRPLDEILAGLS